MCVNPQLVSSPDGIGGSGGAWLAWAPTWTTHNCPLPPSLSICSHSHGCNPLLDAQTHQEPQKTRKPQHKRVNLPTDSSVTPEMELKHTLCWLTSIQTFTGNSHSTGTYFFNLLFTDVGLASSTAGSQEHTDKKSHYCTSTWPQYQHYSEHINLKTCTLLKAQFSQ